VATPFEEKNFQLKVELNSSFLDFRDICF